MSRTLLVLALVLGAIAFGTAACGSSDDEPAPAAATATTGESEAEEEEHGEESATPAEAAAEITEIKDMLDHALEEYREGEVDEADTIVGDAYLEHFEKVEGPLGARDHEFMEELELAISTKIRNRMKEGAAADEVAALVEQTKADLDKAAAMLEEGS